MVASLPSIEGRRSRCLVLRNLWIHQGNSRQYAHAREEVSGRGQFDTAITLQSVLNVRERIVIVVN